MARTMIFNTASTKTNLSLNSQNRLFLCLRIELLTEFLVFHRIKINFVKPEAYAIIFRTASPVFQFMNKRNKNIKNVIYVVFSFYSQRHSIKPEICRLTFTIASSIRKYLNIPFFSISIFLIAR